MLETITMNESARLLPEYADWLDRVRMTRESVAYCCYHRVHRDAALAERVSVEVIAGLLARPKVFRYYGLPFSGRIAHLTEMAIARATTDTPGSTCTWPVLEAALEDFPFEQQEVVVQVCVEGCEDGDLAASLGCAGADALRLRDETLARLEQCSELVLPVNAHRSRRAQPLVASPPPSVNPARDKE